MAAINSRSHQKKMHFNEEAFSDDKVSLAQFWMAFRRNIKWITLFVAFCTFLAGVVSLYIQEKYQSVSVLLLTQPESGKGLDKLIGSASPLLEAIGGGIGKDNYQTLTAILKSRTCAELVIGKLNLLPILFPKKWDGKKGKWSSSLSARQIPQLEDGVKVLFEKHVLITPYQKDNTIKIVSMFSDPLLAKKVADTYVEQLQALISNNNFTVSKKNRVFIQSQLAENNLNLLKSESLLRGFYSKSGLATASKVQIKESDLFPNIKSYPDKRELSGYNQSYYVPLEVYYAFLDQKKKVLSEVNSLLSSQFELAKIEEEKTSLSFQVLDEAREAYKPYSPNKKLILLLGFFASLVLVLFYIFVTEFHAVHKVAGTEDSLHM